MKRGIVLLLSLLLLVGGAHAGRWETDWSRFFVGYQGTIVMLDLRENHFVRYNITRSRQRFVPCSTFKIPNTLIGLDTGVIPNLDYKMKWDGKHYPIASHNRDHTMRSAFKDSVGWYYLNLARRVGPERMRHYVKAFGYGNQKVSMTEIKFWHASLKISAEEQVAFLKRLYRYELPVSRRTMEQARELMLTMQTKRGILRGKTGTDGYEQKGEMIATLGWYVGWVEHGADVTLFATNISGGDNPTGREARRITEAILKSRGLL